MIFTIISLSLAIADKKAPIDSIVECYAENTAVFRRSTDPVETVADAIMTLCEPFEADANEQLYTESIAHVQQNTNSSLAEAIRATDSVREESWQHWRSKMRGQVIAVLVKIRAGQQSNPK